MPDDNAALVTSLFDAFNDGDLARATALVTDDFELVDVATGQTPRGREGCRQWLELFRTALPDAHTEIVNLISDGARVASEHIGRGTHTGPFATPAGTIPPTQRAVELRIGEFYEMHEGKIAKLRAYYDSATMMRQLGLLPPAGSGVEKAMTALMAAGVKARQASRDVDALAHVARRETQAAGHTASMPAPLIEFPADDPDRARKFWHGVLGVTLTPRPASAGTGWQTDTEDLRLGVHERGPGPGDTASLPYFSVGDLGTTLERVRELGGSIIHPGDRWAVCRDSEGSPFALAARAPGE